MKERNPGVATGGLFWGVTKCHVLPLMVLPFLAGQMGIPFPTSPPPPPLIFCGSWC